jgi:hypothetical protein
MLAMIAMLLLLVQTDTVVLDNAYVRVTRDAAPCSAGARAVAGCSDRVIVALADIRLGSRKLKRGDIAVFGASQRYRPPTGGHYFEVAFKPDHPPVQSPREAIRPAKNVVLFENDRLFIFEERLAVGDTRERHSHNQRVVIQLNKTRLRQWPDGEAEVIREIEPDRATFNPAVIHTAKNVGALPLRGIVIELKR